ncbi:MAG: glycoside hydrolase family 5 protein [Treponema sp.]|nr:glycoside hydrolase family 5 protein [Treponema sp.]
MSISLPFSRGINFGKWFETRNFKDIDFNKYTEKDFSDVKSLGVDVIRLPVAFHNYIADKNNTLEADLLKYLDAAVDWAQKHQIYLILDNHSFHPVNPTDINIGKILIPVWEQLAQHFKDRSEYLIYEVLNEPHGIADERWDEIQKAAIEAIRRIDKKRSIVIGGTNYNSIEKMIKLPVYEYENLIYTFHFYDPHLFTHQGATWNKPSLAPLRDLHFPLGENSIPPLHETFKGTWVEHSLNNYMNDSKPEALIASLEKASCFSKERNVPVFCGEFGVFMIQSPDDDRIAWYKLVCGELARLDIPWTCWDYFGGFGVFKTQYRGEFPAGLNAGIINAMGLKI